MVCVNYSSAPGFIQFILLIYSRKRDSRLQMFYKISVSKSFAKFRGTHLCWSLFFMNIIKKRFQQRCFHVNFAKRFRRLFFTEHLRATAFVYFCIQELYGKMLT